MSLSESIFLKPLTNSFRYISSLGQIGFESGIHVQVESVHLRRLRLARARIRRSFEPFQASSHLGAAAFDSTDPLQSFITFSLENSKSLPSVLRSDIDSIIFVFFSSKKKKITFLFPFISFFSQIL